MTRSLPARLLRCAPLWCAALLTLASGSALAAVAEGPAVGPVPVDFLLFALTLLGVALFHHHTLRVALIGVVVITAWKIGFSPFREGPGVEGFLAHFGH